MTTERIIFRGHVQGVGFRYTVRSLARRHPVAGYVRNLPNGTVELVVQGTVAAIDALLADVQGHFPRNISHCERTQPADPESYDGFEIRF
jgi:acylphosphatase